MESETQEIKQFLALANLARLRRQWDEAIDGCVEALRKEPRNPSAHSLLGDIYRDQGKFEDAAEWFRMALDLYANPSDTAKLKQVEGEISRLALSKTRSLPRVHSLDAEGVIPGGTTPLMGIQPRRWLKVMTLSSLSFLGLFLVGLMIYRAGPNWGKPERKAPRSEFASFPTAQTEIKLPPPNPNAPTSLPQGEQLKAQSQPVSAGSGFAQDGVSAGRTLPVDQSAFTNSNGARADQGFDPKHETPPAVVQQVKPSNPTPSDTAISPSNPEAGFKRKNSSSTLSVGEEPIPEEPKEPDASYKKQDGESKTGANKDN